MGLLVVGRVDCRIAMDGPSREGGNETVAVELSFDRQIPRVVLITVRATEGDRLFESLGEVVSRVDFAWCIGQELKLTTKCHVLQNRGLTSSVIGSEERHCVCWSMVLVFAELL
jgi:hypothetical protein